MKRAATARRVNRHLWILDGLRDMPGYEVRPMFGAQSCYLNGLLVLVLSDKDEPWRGVLVPCERELHAAIIDEFPALRPHAILPKWLYLPEATASFERDSLAIVARIRNLDPRFGIIPPARAGKSPSRRPKTSNNAPMTKARFGRPIP